MADVLCLNRRNSAGNYSI